MYKKGAMFGLDARIALAIFGALSVISGAALYSAIQQSKVVSIVTEIDSLSKAIEGFMLDTGIDISDNGFSNFFVGDLIIEPSGVTGWKGPYFPKIGDLLGTDSKLYMDHPIYGNYLFRNLDSDLGGTNYSNPNPCTTKPCYYWIQINGLDANLAKAIDEYIDGSVSVDSGKVRMLDSDNYKGIYVQGPLLLKQP
jgi:hypothetical protein